MAKPWGKYEIDYLGHSKFLALTPNAFWLWWEGKNYCDKFHTDGFIPKEALQTFRFNSVKSVDLLTRSCGLKPNGTAYAPLWDAIDLGGVPHYRMHDYLHHNDCRDEVLDRLQDAEERAEVRRLKDRQRKQAAREARQAELERLRASAERPRNVRGMSADTSAEFPPLSAESPHPTEAVSEAVSVPPSKERKEVPPPPLPPDVRSRTKEPPLNIPGLRFRVWRWMLERCTDALGPHADNFRLDEFLQTLSDRETGVIPDVWPWLLHQVVAEARRRGLPIADATPRKPTVEEDAEAVREILRKQGALQ